MTLFDQISRHELDIIGANESEFAYLNRTGRPELRAAANLMEDWFSRCPFQDRKHIRGHIRSRDDKKLNAAFFELFLMELLCALDCEFETHPNLSHTNKRPDFLVHPKQGDSFYLEAVTVNPSDQETREDRFKSQVLEQIHRIQDPRFHLTIRDLGTLSEQPSGSRIRREVEAWLQELDPRDVDNALTGTGEMSVAERDFHSGDWTITVRAWPKSQGDSRIGIIHQAETSTESDRIENAIREKATRYGKLNLPYVVAVNIGRLPFSNDYNVETAMDGPERWHFQLKKDRTIETLGFDRAGQGALYHQGEPQNTRVSAVLAVFGLQPARVRRTRLKLFHNRGTPKAYHSVLTRLPQAVVEGGRYREIPGLSIEDLFQLPENYP